MISEYAIALMVGFEVTDQATYEARLARPTWPGVDSGITIGIGYDLGYESTIRQDWIGRLPVERVGQLASVQGLTGRQARDGLGLVAGVFVPWTMALDVFIGCTIPRATEKAAEAFPGIEALPADAAGALVSLVYNRGPSLLGPQRIEMRQIRTALAEGRPGDIPQLIRDMKRLWPDVPGLRDRREAEAALFEAGLAGEAVA